VQRVSVAGDHSILSFQFKYNFIMTLYMSARMGEVSNTINNLEIRMRKSQTLYPENTELCMRNGPPIETIIFHFK
jgi:hypothetical protein